MPGGLRPLRSLTEPSRTTFGSLPTHLSPPRNSACTSSVHAKELLWGQWLVRTGNKVSLVPISLLSRIGSSSAEPPPMDAAQSNGHQPRRLRQNPVSCRLCRLKKLKCNRQQPCSNCSARGIGCEYFARNSESTSTGGTDQRQALLAAAERAGFQARLDRLEQAVFGKQDPETSIPTLTEPCINRPQAATAMPEFAFSEEHEVTSRRLENIGTLEIPLVRFFTSFSAS